MFVAYLHKGELIAIYVDYCVQMDTSTFMAGDRLAPAMRPPKCLSQINDVSSCMFLFLMRLSLVDERMAAHGRLGRTS